MGRIIIDHMLIDLEQIVLLPMEIIFLVLRTIDVDMVLQVPNLQTKITRQTLNIKYKLHKLKGNGFCVDSIYRVLQTLKTYEHYKDDLFQSKLDKLHHQDHLYIWFN